jgi:hypothetical protein
LKFAGVLTAGRRATGSMLHSAQGSMGACIMDAKTWAGIAAIIGPLALPLVLLFPNLHARNGDHAQGC